MKNRPNIKYPMATVMPYGPDDKTVTKLVVAIFPTAQDEEDTALERWVATDIATNDAIARQIHRFLKAHGVKTVNTATVVMGCPHEEGQDCHFCPFWRGKQGSGTDDSRWDRLKSVRVERLGFQYRFWMP